MIFKLCKALFILSCITVLILACAINPAAGNLLGDANSDGTVSLLDATCIQSSLSGLRAECLSELSADVDGNNLIEITDATYIQRYLVGMETPYSIGGQIGAPTEAPTTAPTVAPTQAPTVAPTQAPTQSPTDPDGWGYIIYRP